MRNYMYGFVYYGDCWIDYEKVEDPLDYYACLQVPEDSEIRLAVL